MLYTKGCFIRHFVVVVVVHAGKNIYKKIKKCGHVDKAVENKAGQRFGFGLTISLCRSSVWQTLIGIITDDGPVSLHATVTEREREGGGGGGQRAGKRERGE